MNTEVLHICGKGGLAVRGLQLAVHTARVMGDLDVVATANADDRGYDTWEPSLRHAASLLGVEMVPVDAAADVDGLLLLSLEFDTILPVDRFVSNRLYNIHFSLLPRHRGVHTAIWPILEGDSRSGVTLHRMTAGIDDGPIIDQFTIDLHPSTTARSLYRACHIEGARLVARNLTSLLEEDPEGRPQDEADATYHGRSELDWGLCELDIRDSGQEILRRGRAFIFPEYQLPTVGERAVRELRMIDLRTDAKPGTIISDTPLSALLIAGDGTVIEVDWA